MASTEPPASDLGRSANAALYFPRVIALDPLHENRLEGLRAVRCGGRRHGAHRRRARRVEGAGRHRGDARAACIDLQRHA